VPERIIYDGEPGTRWTNDTGKVQYQFIAALINTCGVCLQYHRKIGAWWPIPIHYGCRCEQELIEPEAQAPHDFVDYRELLDKMPKSEQAAAIGASNYKLLKAGVVKWEDIVTPSRVRDLREVVAKKRLTVDQMAKAGVGRRWAEEAHASVNTPEHQLVEQKRREILEKLRNAGLSQEKIVEALSQKLAERVAIGAGEGIAAQKMPTPWSAAADAAALARFLERLSPPPAPRPPPAAAEAPRVPEEPVEVIQGQPGEPGEAIPPRIPPEVAPERLGEMAVDPAQVNKSIDKFLKAHPEAKPTEVAITPALEKRALDQLAGWIRSGRKADLAEVRSILGAEKIAPPIIRYGPTGRTVVVDGHHRLIAYVLRGLTSIEAYVTGNPK
jgi:hypothetical protein